MGIAAATENPIFLSAAFEKASLGVYWLLKIRFFGVACPGEYQVVVQSGFRPLWVWCWDAGEIRFSLVLL